MRFPNRAQIPYVWGAKLPPNQLKEKKMYMGGGGISLCDLAVFLIFCHTFLHCSEFFFTALEFGVFCITVSSTINPTNNS